MLAAFAAVRVVAADPEFVDVFNSGQEGYVSFRIAAVLVMKAGTVLAFAGGRQRFTDHADFRPVSD